MEAHYRVFRSTFASWSSLLGDAAAFASTIGPDRVISISHSCDRGEGVVVVWYWSSAAKLSPLTAPKDRSSKDG